MKNKSSILLSIKLVAARAAKLADDLENNRLWEGELGQGLGEIHKPLKQHHN